MKTLRLLLPALLLAFSVNAQNCFWSYSQSPGTPAVVFQLTTPFSPNQYYATWNFGNGTTGFSAPQGAVTAIYQMPGIYGACVNIIDSITGNTVCTFCDTVVVTGTTNNCFFTSSWVPGTNTVWQFSGSPAYSSSTLQWSFGDGTGGTGNSPQHTYNAPGAYVVCMNEINPNGVTVCTYCDSIYVSGTGGSCQANFTYGQAGSTFSFISAVSGGQAISYSWNMGNGFTSTLPSVTYTYPNPGSYLVCLTITTASGCTDTYCQQVLIPSTNNCQISIIPDTTQQNSYYFQTNASSMLNTISWSFGDSTTAIGANVMHTYAVPGTYTVCVTETAPNGTVVCTNCSVITVGGAPNCTYSSSPIPGANLAMQFTAPVTPGVLYNWNFGDGSSTVVSASNAVSHIFPAPGVYQVCLSLSQAGNTVCTWCDTVMVQGGSGCVFSYTASNPSNPYSILFAGPGYPNATYIWSWGDSTTTTTTQGPSVIHTYAQPGTYQVCLQITANGAVICTACQSVTVSGGNTNCQADFVSVSVGLQAYFIDQSAVPSNALTSYFWTFGDGNTSSLRFPNHQYSNPGWYGVCLSITTGNCSSVHCDSIFIDTAVVVPVNCNSFFLFTQTAPYNIVAVNLASGINLAFNWDFGDGSTSNMAYPSHQYASTGNYQICLTVSDANGCVSTYCDTLTVDSMGNIVYKGSMAGFTLNVLPPNLLGSAGTAEVNLLSGNPYPNPASDRLNLVLHPALAGTVTARVYSLDGRMLSSAVLQVSNPVLNVKSLPSGMYLLELNSTEGLRQNLPFIKE